MCDSVRVAIHRVRAQLSRGVLARDALNVSNWSPSIAISYMIFVFNFKNSYLSQYEFPASHSNVIEKAQVTKMPNGMQTCRHGDPTETLTAPNPRLESTHPDLPSNYPWHFPDKNRK